MSRVIYRSGKNYECREEKVGENLRYFVWFFRVGFSKCLSLVI